MSTAEKEEGKEERREKEAIDFFGLLRHHVEIEEEEYIEEEGWEKLIPDWNRVPVYMRKMITTDKVCQFYKNMTKEQREWKRLEITFPNENQKVEMYSTLETVIERLSTFYSTRAVHTEKFGSRDAGLLLWEVTFEDSLKIRIFWTLFRTFEDYVKQLFEARVLAIFRWDFREYAIKKVLKFNDKTQLEEK